MPVGITYPAALDTSAQLPDVGATDQENFGVGSGGLFHDEILTNHSRALLALETLVGTSPASARPIIEQLVALLSDMARLQADNSANRLNIDALQQQPVWDEARLFSMQARVDALASQIAILLATPAAFDETRLLSRDSRMDAMWSALALLQAAPVPSGSTDPLTIHLAAEVFGS